MKTDEEYINHIKRQYQKRKITGALLIFVSTLIFTLTYLTYVKSNESNYLILDTLQLQHEGDIVRLKDIDNNKYTSTLAYTLGIKTGVLIGSVTILNVVIISQTIIMLFGMRKERLLIKYYELSKKTNN